MIELSEHAFKPSSLKKEKTYEPHNKNQVLKALEIMTKMKEEDIKVVIYNGPSKHLFKQQLKEHLENDYLEDTFSHHHPYKENAHFIQNANKHLKTLYQLSYLDTMLFLVSYETIQVISFGDTLLDIHFIYKEEFINLARTFLIPYHDWYLAHCLISLSKKTQDFYLKHLDSKFLASISIKPFFIGYKQFQKPITPKQRAEVLEKIPSDYETDIYMHHSFEFVYRNLYNK